MHQIKMFPFLKSVRRRQRLTHVATCVGGRGRAAAVLIFHFSAHAAGRVLLSSRIRDELRM